MNEIQMWSVKLGFNGELTQEFYDKYEKVTKVRKKLSIDMFLVSFAGACFSIFSIFIEKYTYFWWFSIIFSVISVIAWFGYFRVFIQIYKHDKRNVIEWEKARMKEEKKTNIIHTPEDLTENTAQ